MLPSLTGIDHVHLHVPDREGAAEWFGRVLGFRIVESLREWARDDGPLTIEDPAGQIHLALFRKDDCTPSTAVAFGADAENFIAWKKVLEEKGILQRLTDHKLAWSMYFRDPYENSYEITTYAHDAVAHALNR